MEDDLNAPKALAITWEAVRSGDLSAGEKWDYLVAAENILSLDLLVPVADEKRAELPAEVQALVDARSAARKAKDWKKSDELRDEIAKLGYTVKDTPQGQQISK